MRIQDMITQNTGKFLNISQLLSTAATRNIYELKRIIVYILILGIKGLEASLHLLLILYAGQVVWYMYIHCTCTCISTLKSTRGNLSHKQHH